MARTSGAGSTIPLRLHLSGRLDDEGGTRWGWPREQREVRNARAARDSQGTRPPALHQATARRDRNPRAQQRAVHGCAAAGVAARKPGRQAMNADEIDAVLSDVVAEAENLIEAL